MPFVGKDWRSPGMTWIKGDKGWEEYKLHAKYRNSRTRLNKHFRHSLSPLGFEPNVQNFFPDPIYRSPNYFEMDPYKFSLNRPKSLASLSSEIDENTDPSHHPKTINNNEIYKNYIIESSPSTEICFKPSVFNGTLRYSSPRGFTSLKEALIKLDFISAVSDLKRYSFVYKVISLLARERLSCLSGNGQRAVFALADRIIRHDCEQNSNSSHVRTLINDFGRAIYHECTYGRGIGSSQLWKNHQKLLTDWIKLAKRNNIDLLNFYATDDLEEWEKNKSINNGEIVMIDAYKSVLHPAHKNENTENMSVQTLTKTYTSTGNQEIKECPKSPAKTEVPVLQNLPFECLLKIVTCLSDHTDLLSLMQCSPVKNNEPKTERNANSVCGRKSSLNILQIVYGQNLNQETSNDCNQSKTDNNNVLPPSNDIIATSLSLCAGQSMVWERLCKYHFTPMQIEMRLKKQREQSQKHFEKQKIENINSRQLNRPEIIQCIQGDVTQISPIDWQKLFFSLKRYYGVKENYADMLYFCLECKCIYWKCIGHSCLVPSKINSENINKNNDKFVKIYPHEFIEIILY